MSRRLFNDCTLATMLPGSPYGLCHKAALVIENGYITWAGPETALPREFFPTAAESLQGRLVTPALIDCHTHLVYGGNRAREFEMRLEGASYEAIARSGGGINATVAATRDSGDEDLVAQSLARLDHLIAEGVAVVEIKSGYGLTVDAELRLLRIARRLGQLRAVKIVKTWLAAHAVPRDFDAGADAYIDTVAIPGLQRAAAENLVDAVDGFCETIAFTPAQIARVFEAARRLNIPVKLHAEQLSDQRGAVLAASYGALSADHLEYLAPRDVPALARAGTVAVLLPGAFYTLGGTRPPPIAALREAGVAMAVATDCNPGSSPLFSILTAMNMACTLFKLTPQEALAGTTRAAAAALGLQREFGSIAPGARAELAVWDIEHPAQLSYAIGAAPLSRRLSAGGSR